MEGAQVKIRIHKFIETTTVEGPGKRACLWVQGCSIHCPGCAVPWTWSIKSGTLEDVDTLAEQILNIPDIQGITFLGGEPFDQAVAVHNLATKLVPKLSIMTFSGYYLEQIQQQNRQGWKQLLEITDLLVAGPFLQEQLDLSRPWIGSKNQNYHFLSERYKHLEHQLQAISNGIELRISPKGEIFINGMLYQKDLYGLANSFGEKR